MSKIITAIAAALTVIFAWALYAHAQLETCRYFAGCSVNASGGACNLSLDRVSCTDTILAFRPGCLPDSCKTDCGCQCSLSAVNTGYHGQVSFYEPCVDSYRFNNYECNNCGNPYPTPSPTPTPTPVPCYPCVGDPGYSSFSYDMCFPDYHWSCQLCRCVRNSPVLIDVNGDGIALTDGPNGVLFDFNGEGAEQIGWTAINSDDAFLVLDRNGNGRIDDGTELFGNRTQQAESAAPHGFLALAEFDRPENGGNPDEAIDSRDAIFSALRLWQARNHNGTSEPGELHSLTHHGVDSIDLNFKESRRRDQYNNEFRYRAKVSGSGRIARYAWDVFLTSW
jgi:hypothetical protein